MGISFSQPLWWLALPLVVFLTWYWRRPWLAQAGDRQAYRRECRRLATRLLVTLLLVAVLAGPRWISTVNHQAVVFALDASASVGPALAGAEEWLRRVLAVKPARDQVGVIAFGEKALVEVPVTETPIFRRLETAPAPSGSNISAALNLARGLLPAGARRRVVLLSDGRDTGSEAATAARELFQAGIRVDVVPVGMPGEADIRLDDINLPARAYAGETSTLQVVVTASEATAATIVIERDGQLLASREVSLLAGTNRLALPVAVGAAGLHRYRVRLVAAAGGDSLLANNEAGAVQQVLGPPRVLLVAAAAGEAAPLREALEAGQVEVEVVPPGGVPGDAAGWGRYGAVFLVNVPALALGQKAMEQLEAYVRDGGGGLVMTGGPDAFGPGGYADTPVEKALPVEMHISGRGELPSLGLVLVIDKSGSMEGYAGGASKINLAKEAAARAASILTSRDQVGVIAFDSSPWWVVPLGPVTDQEALRRQIGSIYAGGGTEIYPALAAAYQALQEARTQVKHIILLTDGRSASGGPYLELTRALAGAGITLTTVAVGEDADSGMLKALAELGRGRFYATAEAATIPTIFTRETMLATRSYAVNERFYPQAVARGPLLAGIEAVPPLDGYIATTPKAMAALELISSRGEPVLAAWQYGLGRAVAWTPDVAGRWSSSWLGSPVFPRLAGNILAWLLPADKQGEVQVQARAREESGSRSIIVDVDDPGRWQEVLGYQATVIGPGGETRVVALQPSGPGRYTGQLPVQKTGAYVVNISRSRSGEEHGGITGGSDATGSEELVARAGVVVPYPAEYRQAGVDLEALAAIARAGGGEVLTLPQEAFAPNLPPLKSSREMAWLLLLLAGSLWFLDVAQRRLSWSREERTELLQAWQAALAAAGQRLALPLLFQGKRAGGSGHTISQLQTGPWGRAIKRRLKGIPAAGRGDTLASWTNGEIEGKEEGTVRGQAAGARQETGGRQAITSFPRDPSQTTAHLLAAKKRRQGD